MYTDVMPLPILGVNSFAIQMLHNHTASLPHQMVMKGLHKDMPDTCRFQPVLLQTVMAACMFCWQAWPVGLP